MKCTDGVALMLSGKVSAAGAGAMGFDTAVPLTAKTARAYFDQGYRFCVRYVSRTDRTRAANAKKGLDDLSEAEGKLILDAGLALMVVQHVAATGWVPYETLGTGYGLKAAEFSQAAGLPSGVNVWLDLEDIPKGTPKADICAYANAWFAEVKAAGYVPGVYVGFNVWLSPDELFFNLATQHYWRADGKIPEVSHRGYQLFQHVVKTGPKTELDKNLAKPDALGGSAIWLAP